MSGYNGRRAPNFSQYLNDLNTIPSPYDQAQQEQEQQDLFDVDAELALFTNAEFLDFDAVGDLPVDMSVKFETGKGADLQNKDTSTTALGDGNSVKYIDMLNGELVSTLSCFLFLFLCALSPPIDYPACLAPFDS